MRIDFLRGDILTNETDLLILPMWKNRKSSVAFRRLDQALDGMLGDAMETGVFEPKMGERFVFPAFGKAKAIRLVVLGCGVLPSGGVETDAWRKAGGLIAKIAREQKARSCVVAMPEFDRVPVPKQKAFVAACTEGVLLGAHRFHVYKGALHHKEGAGNELAVCGLLFAGGIAPRIAKDAIARGTAFAEATNMARDLVNTPSCDMTPTELANVAMKLADPKAGITCRVIDKKEMKKLGMSAALAVARGSEHPPVGIHLTYTPRRPRKTVAVVGKAVTFDSGGLSIKSSDGMMSMKTDMAGAAAVIGLFRLLPVLKPEMTVHGIFLGVENMPSGSAYRPGDVVRAMNGTTIEILNTDAEGRVTLADAFGYALQQKPDELIDLATLTGACIVALGEDMAGYLATDDGIAKALEDAGVETGEALWRLPLFAPYADMVKSKVADIKNIGGGHGAGTITAAHFLRHFVDNVPWAHIDIAGPAYNERDVRPDQPHGASGYGVRLLATYLERRGK